MEGRVPEPLFRGSTTLTLMCYEWAKPLLRIFTREGFDAMVKAQGENPKREAYGFFNWPPMTSQRGFEYKEFPEGAAWGR